MCDAYLFERICQKAAQMSSVATFCHFLWWDGEDFSLEGFQHLFVFLTRRKTGNTAISHLKSKSNFRACAPNVMQLIKIHSFQMASIIIFSCSQTGFTSDTVFGVIGTLCARPVVQPSWSVQSVMQERSRQLSLTLTMFDSDRYHHASPDFDVIESRSYSKSFLASSPSYQKVQPSQIETAVVDVAHDCLVATHGCWSSVLRFSKQVEFLWNSRSRWQCWHTGWRSADKSRKGQPQVVRQYTQLRWSFPDQTIGSQSHRTLDKNISLA